MGHAHHSLPLIYLEEARAAYWREVAGRADVADIDYVLAEVTVRFHRRIIYPDVLDVALRVNRLGGKSFAMEFEIRSGARELVASGSTVQVAFDYGAGTSKEIAADVRRRIEAYEVQLTTAAPLPQT